MTEQSRNDQYEFMCVKIDDSIPMNSDSTTKPRNLNTHRLLTASAVIGAIVMLFAFLRSNGFWIDELYTLHSIRLGWREMVMERLHRGHFPGYFTLVRLWYSLWPEAMFEVALRSMSAAFYLAAVGSFWLLARRTLTQPAALLALALFACNGIALRQASEARMYTVVLLLAVWMVRAAYELMQPGAARRWSVLMVILTMLGFAVSATVGVLVGSLLAVSLWYRRENPRLTRTMALALVLGLLVFIPGAILHVQTADRLGMSSSKPLIFAAHPVALLFGVQYWDDYYRSDTRLLVLLIIGIVAVVGVVALLWRHRAALSPALRRLAIVAALPYVLIMLSYPLVELFELDIMGPPRYLLTLMPVAVLLAGWALARLPRPVVVHGVLTVFLLFSAWTILTVQVEKFRDRMHDYLALHYQPGDGLVVTPHEIADGVELYVPGATVDAAISRWIMDRNELRTLLAPLADRPRVWVVWYRGNDSPLLEVGSEMWGPFESNRPEKEMGSLRVFKFEPPR